MVKSSSKNMLSIINLAIILAVVIDIIFIDEHEKSTNIMSVVEWQFLQHPVISEPAVPLPAVSACATVLECETEKK